MNRVNRVIVVIRCFDTETAQTSYREEEVWVDEGLGLFSATARARHAVTLAINEGVDHCIACNDHDECPFCGDMVCGLWGENPCPHCSD